MREDTARHTNETVGFQQALTDYKLNLSEIDQLAAWVCASSQVYFQYDDILLNEWRERVYLYLIEEAVKETPKSNKISFLRMPQAWASQRPYRRGQDAAHHENYALYRRRRFDNFLETRLNLLPEDIRMNIATIFQERVDQELVSYQRQMSILATLNPDRYRENKQPIPLWQARVGVIMNGRYYLLPACYTDQQGRPLLFETEDAQSPFQSLRFGRDGALLDSQGNPLTVDHQGCLYRESTSEPCGYLRPAPFQAIRRQVRAIFDHAQQTEADPGPGLDNQLIAIRRADQERARKAMTNPQTIRELQALKYTPIILNWDQQDASKPLAYIRQNKRGTR